MQYNDQSNQPLYSAQPVAFSLQNLKSKLCCPVVYTWILFIFSIVRLYGLWDKLGAKVGLGSIVTCVLSFLIALFVTLGANTGDVRKYNWALYICIGCLVVECVASVLIIVFTFSLMGEIVEKLIEDNRIERKEKEKFIEFFKIFLIVFFVIYLAIESITLCVLCCYKKAFDGLPLPSNQPIIPPQVVY